MLDNTHLGTERKAMNLQDWLEKARGHKYIRKYVGPGGKTYYEYMTPGGQKVSVPSRGAAEAERKGHTAPVKDVKEPPKEARPVVKEAAKQVEKVKPAVPSDKGLQAAKKEVKAVAENEKMLGLASQVVRAAIPKADRGATLKAARALLELAKQPGQKGKVLGEIRALSALARVQAKMINNRYNADRNRDKPPRGRDFLYTYDDVLAARSVRDLIDKARSKVQEIKAGKKADVPVKEVKVDIPSVSSVMGPKPHKMGQHGPPRPLKPIEGGAATADLTEEKLSRYPKGTKIQWTGADGKLNEATLAGSRWQHRIEGRAMPGTTELSYDAISSESLANKLQGGAATVSGDAAKEASKASPVAKALGALNMDQGPYHNNARLRAHIEKQHPGDVKAQSIAIDKLAIEAMDFYSDAGDAKQRQKMVETALSTRHENILEGTHTDVDGKTALAFASALTKHRRSTYDILKNSMTKGERESLAKVVDQEKDPEKRAVLKRELATIEGEDKREAEGKKLQEQEAKRQTLKESLIKPGDIYVGSMIGSSLKVKKKTPKSVTVFIPGGQAGARFTGKSYTYKWDGTGYKRGGYYLADDGTIPVSDLEKSMPAGVDGWLAQADDDLEKSYDAIKAAYKKKYGADAWDKIDVPKEVEESKAKAEKLPFGSKTKLGPEEKHRYTEAKRRLAGSLGMPKTGWGLYGRSIVGALKEKEKKKGKGEEMTEKSCGMAHKSGDLSGWIQKAEMADDGKPGKSLKETSTDELKATLAKLKPTDAGAEARIKAIKAELASRGGMEKAKAMPSATTNLSPEKARQMLHERSGGHGRPITEQQRKFFGAIGGHLPAPGSKTKKSMGVARMENEQQGQGSAEAKDRYNEGAYKSMDANDWLEKALPTHEVRMGGPKSDVQGGSQDGGDWEGKGKTPDSNGGPVDAAGTDAQGKVTGVDPGKQEKLSEDDEDQGEIGAPEKKKPIEKMGKSELYPMPLTPARQRDMVAHEVAKLRKSPEMVTIGPENHPYGYQQTMGADTEELAKSEGSVDIPRLSYSPGQSLAQSQVLCKSVHAGGCDSTHSAMLTACPECGAGTTRHRIWPNSSEVQVIPVAGPGGLRPAKRDPMIKIN